MHDDFGLYLILTDPVVGYDRAAEAAVENGVALLQLRMKGRPAAEVLRTARVVRALTLGTRTLFIVNDFVDIAAAVDADGVHLGQDDMPLGRARSLWPSPGKIFGLSTHTRSQAGAALAQKADYIGVGPVFPTPAKAKSDPVLGLEEMGAIIRACALPCVAIGGIDAGNLPSVLAAGALNFAVVRAVNASASPSDSIRALMSVWQTHPHDRAAD